MDGRRLGYSAFWRVGKRCSYHQDAVFRSLCFIPRSVDSAEKDYTPLKVVRVVLVSRE
jgi:hypothetical protein